MSNTFNIIKELVDVLYKEHINFYNISEKEESEKIKHLEIQVYEQKKMIDNLEKINESNIILLNKYKSELELLLCVQNKDSAAEEIKEKEGGEQEEKQQGDKRRDGKNKCDKRKEGTSTTEGVIKEGVTTGEGVAEEEAVAEGTAAEETGAAKKEKKRDRRNYMREYQKLYREKKRSEKHDINM